ncbi:MAG: small ribosomal subunit Rsm22 family protein [Candidatus Kapaibacterium sp.]
MNTHDWNLLQNIRQKYLDGTAGKHDYWESTAELELYNNTFAQRIGWKWEYVLSQLDNVHWQLPNGTIIDYGCGSGIAGRKIIEHFGTEELRLLLHDRSNRAMEFSQQAAQLQFPNLSVEYSAPIPNFSQATVVISHVITELSEEQIKSLCIQVQSAQCVLWVEPGTYVASRALLHAHQLLKSQFNVIAPCTHKESYGMNTSTNKRHWCHFFATPPEEAFTDRNWSRFTEETGIDLSDLPLSYLVLDKRPTIPYKPDSMRFIARADVQKYDAIVVGCSATGVKDYVVSKRTSPEVYKLLKKGNDVGVVTPDIRGREILSLPDDNNT